MGWLLLAAAAVAVFVFAKKEQSNLRVSVWQSNSGDGTWHFTIWGGVPEHPVGVGGPFASELAARAAAAAWLATNSELPPVIETPTPPVPEPIDIVPGGPQGEMAPYLTVSGGGVVGSAVVRNDGVAWSVGDESDVAGSAVSANATLLSRIDSRAAVGAPMTMSMRKSDGRIVQARVSNLVGPNAGWVWSVSTPPAVPGGVGSSTTRPEWRANSRLAAMRAALTTLQDM